MLHRFVVLLALLFVGARPAEVSAQQEKVLIVSQQGYFLLDLDATGKPVLNPITKVVNLGTPTVPPPGPDPAPNTLRQKVKSLAQAAGDPTGAKGLSVVYSTVATRVESGELDPAQSFAAVTSATDLLLSQLGTSQKWTAWRGGVSEEIVLLQQKGALKTKADYVAVLKSVSGGLDDYLSGAGILDNINWEKLFEIIKLVIELLSAFK